MTSIDMLTDALTRLGVVRAVPLDLQNDWSPSELAKSLAAILDQMGLEIVPKAMIVTYEPSQANEKIKEQITAALERYKAPCDVLLLPSTVTGAPLRIWGEVAEKANTVRVERLAVLDPFDPATCAHCQKKSVMSDGTCVWCGRGKDGADPCTIVETPS